MDGDWTDWIDLAHDDEEMADQAVPNVPEQPTYPWGTSIVFTGRELEKTGLPLPHVGDLLDVRALCKVTSVSDGNGGQRVEMQICMVKLENEDAEAGDEEADEPARPKRNFNIGDGRNYEI